MPGRHIIEVEHLVKKFGDVAAVDDVDFLWEKGSFSLTLLGHAISIAEDALIVAAFGLLMTLPAMWSLNMPD